MNHFKTQREAKEFLVVEIVREADRRGHPLSEIERKMLYFSEGDPTLGDMASVADKFDQECDRTAYERTIAKLARDARSDPTTDRAAWSEAIERLEGGDHYLLVLIGEAGAANAMTWRGAVAVVSILVGLGIGWAVLSEYFTRDQLGLLIWAGAAAILVIGSAIRFFRRRPDF